MMMSSRLLIRLALCVSVVIFPSLTTAATEEPAKRTTQPNILFILTDDQDLHLNSLEYMPNLQSMLMKEGTYFPKHYGHISICCPARATIWMGKHSHNTNVTTVWGNVAGGGWPQIQATGWYKKYLPVWMQAAGYNTYYSGKIFNWYKADNHCDPVCLQGWSKANVLYDPSTYYYYNSSYSVYDGNSWKLENTIGYSTDQIAENVANYIGEVANQGPFFAVAAPVAIHEPHIPKKEYANLYPDAKVPRTPNFNPDNRTGVATTWTLDQLDEENVKSLDEQYRLRLQTLKSVDDLIGTLIDKLKEVGVLDNTYIFFTTDNGYHIGQHRLQAGKYQCFEEDINLPFVIRGPDVRKNYNSSLVTGHIDLAPTMLGLTGMDALKLAAQTDIDLDGTPITFPLETEEDFARNADARGDSTHVEFWGPFGQEGITKYANIGLNVETHLQTYKALRLQGNGYNLMYSVWCQDSAHELYDMSWDSQQMTNLHPDAPSENGTNAYQLGMNTVLGLPTWKLIHRLDALVLVLKTCSGDACRRPWKELHPLDNVASLQDALDQKYDFYYKNMYSVGKVGWLECYGGLNKKHSSTLYSLANEVPIWQDGKIVQHVKSEGGKVMVKVGWAGAAVFGALVWWWF